MTAGALAYGPEVMARADALAACTEQEEGLTRVFLSPEHKAATGSAASHVSMAHFRTEGSATKASA